MEQMLKKRLFYKKISFLLLWFLLMPACYLNLTGVGSDHLTLLGSEAPADSDFFYVDLDIDAYESNDEKPPKYEMNTTERYGDAKSRDSRSNCEIEHIPYEEGEERDFSQTILCILDVGEFEFAVKNFHIVYNFPEEMCEYTSVALPWHFNYPIHPGPVVETCEDDTSTDEEESGYRCNSDISTCDGTCHPDENDLCPGGDGEPPCCYGGEKEDGTKWLPHPECFGGPGTISPQFPAFNGDEINVHTEYITDLKKDNLDGLRRTLSLSHLLSFNNTQNTTAPHANYLSTLAVPPEDLKETTNNDLPVFLQQSVYPYVPNPYFVFTCLDSGRETPHQIFLMIREWNTWEELRKFIESGGRNEGEGPDVEGLEGPDCDYEERPVAAPCNDEYDLDDYADYPRVDYGLWEGDNAEE